MPISNLAVVLPCYNVESLCGNVLNTVHNHSSRIVAVNDGSTDRTQDVLSRYEVQVLTHATNQGKGSALRTGFQYLLDCQEWDFVATIDSDGQHDPQHLPDLVKPLVAKQADLVIGAREFSHDSIPFIRKIANTSSSALISFLVRTKIRDIQSGYRIYARHFIEEIYPLISSTGFEIETELLILALKKHRKIQEVPITTIYNDSSSRASNWRAFSDSWRIAKIVSKHLFS